MPSTQSIWHTRVSVLAHKLTAILYDYLLVKHMTALKYAWQVSEATESTQTYLIFFYPVYKLIFKVELLAVVKKRFVDLTLTLQNLLVYLFLMFPTWRTEAGIWSQQQKWDIQLTQLGFTTLTGWTILFNLSQRGSSLMANRAALSKSSLNCFATVSNCTVKIRCVSFVNFFVHFENRLLGNKSVRSLKHLYYLEAVYIAHLWLQISKCCHDFETWTITYTHIVLVLSQNKVSKGECRRVL